MECRVFDPQLCIVQLTDFHFGKELQGNYRNRVDDILGTIGYIVEHPHMSKSARQSLVDTVFKGNQKAKATFLKSAQA